MQPQAVATRGQCQATWPGVGGWLRCRAMRRPPRPISLVLAVAAGLALSAAPAWSTESGTAGDEEPAATTSPAEGESGGHERVKIEPPMTFTDPQDVVGWGLLGLTGLTILAASVNALKQLRGERPRADGSWRPR